MKTQAAVLTQSPGVWEVREVELDEPRQGELLIQMVASGMCHSDDHMATGDFPPARLPLAGGHEGAGIVARVGPHTDGFQVGDHVVLSFIGVCGRCRWCASGQQNLCDRGANLLVGNREDGTFRMHLEGMDLAQMSGISTFATYSVVSTSSAVRVDKAIPLEAACLVGCGVATGWGAAVNSASVQIGDVVIVMGAGGVGINAVQGAAHAGAQHVIAVDPVSFKRAKALQFGATEAFSTMEEADDFSRSVTNGQGADSSIVTVGVLEATQLAQAFGVIRKAGICVVVAGGKAVGEPLPLSIPDLVFYQKRLQGSLYGAMNPTRDIPRLLSLYQNGRLKLNEIVTRTYALQDINSGFADMRSGLNLRGVITHYH